MQFMETDIHTREKFPHTQGERFDVFPDYTTNRIKQSYEIQSIKEIYRTLDRDL